MERPIPSSPMIAGTADALYDEGLRRHMTGIYRNMATGLAITGAVAFGIAATPGLYEPIFNTPLKWVAMFAPLAFMLIFSFRVERMSIASARAAFFAFAAVMGLSMASIFLTFTGQSIATTFFIAASMFLVMSLWGYTTRRDLSKWSTFLFMGLIGVVIASLVNLFVGSTVLHLVMSIAGVLVFTGLTAWDTQRAKSDYLAHGATQEAEKLAIMSALSLYLSLVNLFQLLLSLFGQRQES
jgi:FtsH-binding integral membrane protein